MYTAQGLLLTKSQFPVGRHEAVKLKEVVKGDNFIDYIYASPQGDMESNKRTWFPKQADQYVRENETDLEAFERAQKEFLTFLSKHMHIFLPKELFETFSAPDFNSFIDKAVPLLNQYKDSCLINIQLIPNRDLSGATFSYYPNYIERHTPGQPSKLTYSTWELDNRVKPWNLKQGIGSSNWGAGESISPTPVSSQLGNLI